MFRQSDKDVDGLNLVKLFPMQKVLDDRIVKDKGLEGKDLLDKKILALKVELGELTNELPEVFKFWSNKKNNFEKALKEYADGLHFILSIGNEIKCKADQSIKMINSHTDWILENRDVKNTSVTEQFIVVFAGISDYYQIRGLDEYFQMFSEFLILGEKLGFTDKQVEEAYIKKNEINHARQQNGY